MDSNFSEIQDEFININISGAETNKNNKINIRDIYYIKINGSVSGYVKKHNDVDEMYNDLMLARRNHTISQDTSIVLNHNLGTLEIWTDTGRLMSPFIIIKNCFEFKEINEEKQNDKNTIKLSDKIKIEILLKKEFKEWRDDCATKNHQYQIGLDKGFIELLDVNMAINNCVIAPSTKDFYENPTIYTHLSLPMHIHGPVTAMVSGFNMNKGVRGSLMTNHVKQAIGVTMRYPQLKYFNESNILISPHIPIARPCTYNYMHMNETPYGQNVIVAFMFYKFNQEDSLIFNKASVESGLLQIDSLVTKIVELEKDQEFKLPEKSQYKGNPDSYSKLDPSTVLPKRVGEKFYQNDVLIAKVEKSLQGERDISLLNDRPDGKYPPSVNLRPLRCIVKNKLHDDNKVVKMTQFGQYRTTIIGDKFNSECAQKGTCGSILDARKIPYTTSGLRPDIIFNPPSIFKRETYSQIYLGMLYKICALLGCPIDCTPYQTQRSIEDLEKLAKSLGIDDKGEEIFYDPETGRKFRSKVFVVNHYWERQPHLVEQKLNIRNNGARTSDTNQPVRGRKRGGGQSIDRMAMDDLFASGIGLLNRDAHLVQGSSIQVAVCNRCKSMKTYYQNVNKCWVCAQCGSHPDFTIKVIPPAANLINHVFNALHISVDYYEDGNQNNDFENYQRYQNYLSIVNNPSKNA